MVEQVDNGRDGTVNLNGHRPDKRTAKTKPTEDSSLMRTVYKQVFRSRAVYPLLFMAAVQTSKIAYKQLQLQGFLSNVEIPATVDTYALFLTLMAAGLACLAYFFFFTPGPTLLLDFACFKPDDTYKVSRQTYIEKARRSGFFTEKSVNFQEKVLALAGLGDETYGPPSTLCEPVDRSLKTCHSEAQTVILGVTDELFSHGVVKPKDIDILVVNCSMYSPVPSLAAMIVNHYRMRKDIDVFNLGGMGCSAGLIAIDLARKLLRGRRNSYALVVSMEAVSAMFGYSGNDRSMMVGNCLFRTGGSGVLLTNRRGTRILLLKLLIRTHNVRHD